MSKWEQRRSSGGGAGVLNRLIVLIILIPVAVAVILFLLSPNSPLQTHPTPEPPKPVLIAEIHKQYKLVTAEVQAEKVETGKTQSALPFSTDEYQYEAVFTYTAGIDLSQLKDADIVVSGTTAIIHLPEPQILAVELDLNRSKIISHDQQLLAGLSQDPNLLTEVQAQAQKDVTQQVLEQGQLISDAKEYAEEDIANLAHQLGYTDVQFVYDTPTPPVTPMVTAAPA